MNPALTYDRFPNRLVPVYFVNLTGPPIKQIVMKYINVRFRQNHPPTGR
jgi:hypothetical protein